MPFIETRNIIKKYASPAGEFTALKGINLQVEPGEFVAVTGKSGSGKSTLINMLTGIDRPSSGEVVIGGTAIHKLNEAQMAAWRGRNLGIIFQFFQLLPTLTLIENVMLPMDLNNTIKPRYRRDQALSLLELVDMAPHAHKLPNAVSGGQQQRVAIARALANNPPLIIADEPTGNLDSKTAENVFQLFERLVAGGKTILMVTHDDYLARRATRTVMIADGEVVNAQLLKALSSTLTQDQILEVKCKITPQQFAPGAEIIAQGSEGQEFFIVLEGEAEVYVASSDGTPLFVQRHSPGNFFGEMALMGDGRRQATVRAGLQTGASLAVLDRTMFDTLVSESKSLRDYLGQIIEERAAEMQQRRLEDERFQAKLRAAEARLEKMIAEENAR